MVALDISLIDSPGFEPSQKARVSASRGGPRLCTSFVTRRHRARASSTSLFIVTMDVFISNLDSRFTRDKLQDSLAPILLKLQIHVFYIKKTDRKTFATLTIADASKAQNLLAQARANPSLLSSPSGRQAQFQISRRPLNPHLLRVLHKEEKDRQNLPKWEKSSKLVAEVKNAERQVGLKVTALQCGRWETMTEKASFTPYFQSRRDGSLTRVGRALVIRMNSAPSRHHDLIIDLSNILSFAGVEEKASSTLLITLALAPRIYEDESPGINDLLHDMFAGLHLGPQPFTRFRESTLPGLDPAIVGSCLTYSLVISSSLASLEHRIKSMTSHRIPITLVPATPTPPQQVNYAAQLSRLNARVARLKCSFAWRYQIHGLWANGLLSPAEVDDLLPAMNDLRARKGEAILISVLRRLHSQMPQSDASTDPRTGGFRAALNAITNEAGLWFADDGSQTPTRDEVSVHRVIITPTGVYLYGPELMASNRVLREYRDHSDCFLRVLFSEENETRIEFDRDVSNERIFRGRFLSILRNGLNIANEHFDYLGFSHSSLRSQTCWFMRPFVHKDTLLFAKDLISKLGDFSGIKCPAKCAARIGQAFSETTTAVPVEPSIVQVCSDVKVGQHVFTDGCGTISKATWTLLRTNVPSQDQPTSYQIRYKGE